MPLQVNVIQHPLPSGRRCYKLGHDVPHAGGVIPNWIIGGRYFDAKDIVPHLFEERVYRPVTNVAMLGLRYESGKIAKQTSS